MHDVIIARVIPACRVKGARERSKCIARRFSSSPLHTASAFFQIVRGIAVEHLLELCQHHGAHMLHAATSPRSECDSPLQAAPPRALGGRSWRDPDAFQIVAQPQRADELAQINPPSAAAGQSSIPPLSSISRLKRVDGRGQRR